ncbi:hypothetical protein MMC29_007670 [Sticta canariensis]|nr:hypothetical protein [Sticta canariensis]
MAQPDYQSLSVCLAEAAQEFALCRNAPSAITNRALINFINELRDELRRTEAETRAHIDEAKREIETLCTDILSRMEEASETNAIARLHNSRISKLETAFRPLRDHQNVVPDIFPANGYALLTLNYYELNTLLEKYQFFENGCPRRYLLAKFIGVANHEYYYSNEDCYE